MNKLRAASIKAQLIIFLASFAVFLAFSDRGWSFLLTLLLAVSAAILSEAMVSFLKTKKPVFSSSAAITGLIIGFVLAAGQPWWKIVLASVIAIASKTVLRFSKRHIFNPAAFGILFAVLFLGVYTEWRGTYVWQILVPFGCYFAYKIRKLELLAGYAVTALTLFGIQAVLQNVPVAGIFGYLSYFFIFIMMIEPKTTPAKPIGKMIFGAGVGALIFIFTQMAIRVDAELAALLTLNIFTQLLNKIPAKLFLMPKPAMSFR